MAIFHVACDAFFEERRVALGLRPEDPQANLEHKLALIEEAEALASASPEAAAQKVRVLQRDWRRIGPVPRAQSDYVWRRFNAACDAVGGTPDSGMGRADENRETRDREAESEAAGPANS